MTFSRIVLTSLVGAAAAQPTWVPPFFRVWASEHGKTYRTENEWARAYQNYQDDARIIEDLNGNTEDQAEYEHNKYSDMSVYEWKEKYFGSTMSPEEGKKGAPSEAPTLADTPMPDAVDWQAQGAVTPVKDQSSCGSCWAESAVGNVESIWYIANKANMKAPVSLSTEQLIECDTHGNACYGGFPRAGFKYVIEHGGLASKEAYPYTRNGKGNAICLANQTFNATCGDGMCDDPPLTDSCGVTCSDKTPAHKSVGHVSSWHALPTDEDKIAASLAQNGPVSVALDASGGAIGALFPWLKSYKKGVANPKRCTTDLDHAVLLVGYGVDNGVKYWKVKNSWGADWGDNGYFKLIRGVGKCGINLIATSSSMPTVNSTQTVVV